MPNRIHPVNMNHIEIFTINGKAYINELPNECPFCHRPMIPIANVGYRASDNHLDVLLSCPFNKCLESFIGGYYRHNTSSDFYDFSGKVSRGNIIRKEFNELIKTVSPSFEVIYNQAYFAEQEGLLEICGVGYRKALEFIIKDYAISKNPTDKEQIEKKTVGFMY